MEVGGVQQLIKKNNHMKTELEKVTRITLEKKDGKLHYGGYLDLQGTGITSLPENLTVGGSLYLQGTGITSLPENLTVGGSLNLQGTGITDTSSVKRNIVDFFEWRNKTYIKTDGIFSKVVSRKGNIYKITQIGDLKERYLITDGNGKWSHGDTLKEAKEDLIYKISSRNKDDYKNLTLDSELTFQECVEAYRVITGACSFGTRNFVENRLSEKKEKYKISEVIELTRGEYKNSEFSNFFSK